METEPNLDERIEVLSKKIDAVYESVEKTRKYFLVTMWVTLAVIVLPALALTFVLPMFINSYVSTFEGLL